MSNDLHVKCPLFLSDLMALEFSLQIFEKYSNMKFLENTSSGSGIVPCWRTDRQTDKQTDRHDEANSRCSQFFESD